MTTLSEIEQELFGLLAIAKQQQTNIDAQLAIIQAASTGLEETTRKLAAVLVEVREMPIKALGPVKTVVEGAIKAQLPLVLADEKEVLSEAVDGLSRTIALAALAGTVVGGVIVGVVFWVLLKL